jgi:hypothetical protein
MVGGSIEDTLGEVAHLVDAGPGESAGGHVNLPIGDGPEVRGRPTVLCCAWLAWSRFRVVLPQWDRTIASVVMGLTPANGRARSWSV